MMIVTKKLKYGISNLHMGGPNLNLMDKIKLLGITIHSKLTFKDHVADICRKVTNIYKLISKIAEISWGLEAEITRQS